jgi:hypothetical protein
MKREEWLTYRFCRTDGAFGFLISCTELHENARKSTLPNKKWAEKRDRVLSLNICFERHCKLCLTSQCCINDYEPCAGLDDDPPDRDIGHKDFCQSLSNQFR